MRKLFTVVIILIFNILYVNIALASTHGDTTVAANYNFFAPLSAFPNHKNASVITDNTLAGYNSNDLIFNNLDFISTISNVGFPTSLLTYDVEKNVGFGFSSNIYNNYILNDDNVKIWHGTHPYTELSYCLSPGNNKAEESIYVTHNQNIGKTISIGGAFYFLNSKGMYLRQHNMIGNGHVNATFRTLDNRYGFVVSYHFSRISTEENGGMSDDSQFFDNTVKNRKIVDINLDNAATLTKDGGLHFNHDFILNHKDSTKAKLRLYHKFSLTRDRQLYTDDNPNPAYYPIELHAQKIKDSSFVRSIDNTIALTNRDTCRQKFHFTVGSEINAHKVAYAFYKGRDTVNVKTDKIFNVNPFATVTFNFKRVSVTSQGAMSIFNGNTPDYAVDVKVKTKINDFEIDLTGYSVGTEPLYFYKHYYSTLFTWDNDFRKTITHGMSLHASYHDIDISLIYNNIHNFCYLDNKLTAQQHLAPINHFSASLDVGVDIWKFTVTGRCLYQHVSDEVMKYPEFVALADICFNQKLFKGGMETIVGVKCFYETKYKSNGYFPALHSFYVQNEFDAGGFVYFDVYLKIAVSRAKFFVELINCAQGLLPYNYVMVPHYPLNDRQLKFGINWTFDD